MSIKPFAKEILNDQKFISVDIGAANGLLQHWATLQDTGFFYLVEPDTEACKWLDSFYKISESGSEHFKILPYGLSGTGGKRVLNFLKNCPTSSSLLSLNKRAMEYVSEDVLNSVEHIELETRTLESIFEELKEPQIDMMKLDIQGIELEVIKSLGKKRLDQILSIELEIGMPGGYENQSKFGDVDKVMEEHGLEIWDIRPARTYRPYQGRQDYYQREIFGVYETSPTISARIWEIDALYFRKASDLLEKRDASALRRLITVYCTHNFFSEAYHLAGEAQKKEIFTSEQTEKLKTAVVAWHKKLHYKRHLAPTPLFDSLRKIQSRFSLKTGTRWCQYIQHEYPNG